MTAAGEHLDVGDVPRPPLSPPEQDRLFPRSRKAPGWLAASKDERMWRTVPARGATRADHCAPRSRCGRSPVLVLCVSGAKASPRPRMRATGPEQTRLRSRPCVWRAGAYRPSPNPTRFPVASSWFTDARPPAVKAGRALTAHRRGGTRAFDPADKHRAPHPAAVPRPRRQPHGPSAPAGPSPPAPQRPTAHQRAPPPLHEPRGRSKKPTAAPGTPEHPDSHQPPNREIRHRTPPASGVKHPVPHSHRRSTGR